MNYKMILFIKLWSAENFRFRFCYFAEQGHLLPMILILYQGIDCEIVETLTGNTPLVLAAQNNQLTITSYLLNQNAKINSTASKNGKTALFSIIEESSTSLPMIRLLLLNRADVNIISTKNKSMLYIAAENNHLKKVEILLVNGVNIETICNNFMSWYWSLLEIWG